MRVGGKAAAVGQFTAEIVEVAFVQTKLQIGAGVIAGSGVALKINQVGGPLAVVAAAEEMVVANFVKIGHGGVAGNVAADLGLIVLGLDDHGHGIPAGQAFDAALQFPIAGIMRLGPRRDGVDVGGADGLCHRRAGRTQAQDEVVAQETGDFGIEVSQAGFDGSFQGADQAVIGRAGRPGGGGRLLGFRSVWYVQGLKFRFKTDSKLRHALRARP